MIALEIDRARLPFIAIDGPARNSGDFLVVDNGYPVLNDRNKSAQERDLERLPDARSPRLFGDRRDETIDTAHVMAWRLLNGIVLDLYLVAAAQINTAIGFRGTVDFDVQFEITEPLLCSNV